jgi:lipopolysaccharide transport system permease protein
MPDTPPVLRITAERRSGLGFVELWRARELTLFFALREIKSRYRQTVLGVGWAVLQPLMAMLVFYVVFGRIGKMATGSVPYPVFALSGLIAWQLFSSAVTGAGQSLVGNQGLLTKVYFERLALPVSATLIAVVDAMVALGLLAIVMVWSGVAPDPLRVLAMPLVLALVFALAAGVGVWLAALVLRFRDLRHALPLLIQLWMFASPVGYPASRVPAEWRPLYDLNPVVGAIEAFRWTVIGGDAPPMISVVWAAVAALVLFTTGAAFFQRVERTFADIA